MHRNDTLHAQLLALCAELGPEDGSNAREFYRRAAHADTQSQRKIQQLCGQIARAINLALGSAHSTALQSTRVLTVKALESGELCVDLVGPPEAITIIASADGWLREEVARAIHRRRVPRLRFIVLPEGAAV